MAAADDIRLNGLALPVLPPSQVHKQLGVRMTLNSDFSQEKTRMYWGRRLSALQTDRVVVAFSQGASDENWVAGSG